MDNLNFLIICTSNKDRSPALVDYFKQIYPNGKYRSVGINGYFCDKHGTHLISWADIKWSDILVFCEDIHFERVKELYKGLLAQKEGSRGIVGLNHNDESPQVKNFVILNCGDYKVGPLAEDYLTRAEQKLVELRK